MVTLLFSIITICSFHTFFAIEPFFSADELFYQNSECAYTILCSNDTILYKPVMDYLTERTLTLLLEEIKKRFEIPPCLERHICPEVFMSETVWTDEVRLKEICKAEKETTRMFHSIANYSMQFKEECCLKVDKTDCENWSNSVVEFFDIMKYAQENGRCKLHGMA